MLNAFAMRSAITESVGRARRYNFEPYNFIGDLDGSTFNEATNVMLVEAAIVQEMYTKTDELIAEAASNGVSQSKIDIMVENVFSNLIDAVKKVWNKIIEAIRGLIAKIKAFALRMTNQTGKWCNAMKSKIDAVSGKVAGASSAKAEMYDWNDELFNKVVSTSKVDTKVTDELTKALREVKDVMDEAKKGIDEWKPDDSGSSYKMTRGFEKKEGSDHSYDRSSNSVTLDYGQKDGKFHVSEDQEKGNTKALDVFQRKTETITKNLENVRRENFKAWATACGVTGTTADEIFSNAKKKLYGEKKTITYGNKVSTMFQFVEKSTDLTTNTVEYYNKELEFIQNELDEINKLDEALKGISIDKNSMATAMWGKYKANLSAVLNELTATRKDDQTLTNKFKGLATQAVKDRAADYMRVLTKYTNAKSFE